MKQLLRVSLLSLVVRFGFWAFLISPSVAQVNGPGTSSSSAFNTVINLPGDEAIISGGFGENIGGTPGQTVQLNVDEGGTIGPLFQANEGGEVNIRGGQVGAFLTANEGSKVNISGGNIGSALSANSGSVLNISGGNLGNFRGNANSTVNLIGRRFFVDFVELNNLPLDEASTITDRNVFLTGVLANGTPFSLPLNGNPTDVGFFFSADATVTVTLTNPVLPGDVNTDGTVDFLDIAPFVAVLTAQGLQAEADVNGGGDVNFLDVFPLVEILSNQ